MHHSFSIWTTKSNLDATLRTLCTAEYQVLSLSIQKDFISKSDVLFCSVVTSDFVTSVKYTYIALYMLLTHSKQSIPNNILREKATNLEYIFPKNKLHNNHYLYPKWRWSTVKALLLHNQARQNTVQQYSSAEITCNSINKLSKMKYSKINGYILWVNASPNCHNVQSF